MNKVNTMIKLLRTEKGMNQEQLAEQLHVTRQAVSSWETGKTRPDMGPNCSEWLDPEFAKWIWTFNGKNRKKYHELLSQQEGKEIHIFRNRRQLRKFLNQI